MLCIDRLKLREKDLSHKSISLSLGYPNSLGVTILGVNFRGQL